MTNVTATHYEEKKTGEILYPPLQRNKMNVLTTHHNFLNHNQPSKASWPNPFSVQDVVLLLYVNGKAHMTSTPSHISP